MINTSHVVAFSQRGWSEMGQAAVCNQAEALSSRLDRIWESIGDPEERKRQITEARGDFIGILGLALVNEIAKEAADRAQRRTAKV